MMISLFLVIPWCLTGTQRIIRVAKASLWKAGKQKGRKDQEYFTNMFNNSVPFVVIMISPFEKNGEKETTFCLMPSSCN